MRAAEILRKLADIVDSAEQGPNTDEIGRSLGSDGGDVMANKTMQRMEPVPEPDQDTGDDDKMVPPLQQKHELLKKVAGVDNEYDREEQGGCGDAEPDELHRMKKMAGIVIAGDENDIN
jgi:hypothetical protein